MNEAIEFSNDAGDCIYYSNYFPSTEQTRMIPLLDQCYTSIVKDSDQIENCLALLAALNTNEQLCSSMYEEPSRGYMENPTGKFVYLCNYYLATNEKEGAQTQNERVAALTEDQISPILGFTFDRTPVEEEVKALEMVSKEMGECEEFKELVELIDNHEMYNERLSQVWTESMEKYKQALKEAGIDAVIEEANRQLAEWQAGKDES